MPYIRIDAEMYDEIAEELGDELSPGASGERPSGAFQYESAEAKLQSEKIGPVSRAMLEILRQAGATSVDVSYDGGYDEGFARLHSVRFGNEALVPADAIRRLATAQAAQCIRSAVEQDPRRGGSEYYARATDALIIERASDELAIELAIALIGPFGTGEYQIYGRLTADILGGRLVDNRDAERPENTLD